ncbi:sulfotransferase family protein [Desulfuribacillus alkaliarsenatis]|uniref:Sulfotransferase n=1 Tax=Desulfuribacillus alkaliarsenatis TaxID=766136 RepID=A0A1E5G1X9_9FIRM|nr:sulfotransferase [Desulfuribacillus alkaliarsenatis]OEF96832.1 hypothetical protein BHF68_07165 [Desulfuribacillus alkaliarsenatis]
MKKAQKDPIFIGGDGRSGTTLLSLILNSHKDIACGPELHFRGPKNLGSYILECLDKEKSSEKDIVELKKIKELNPGMNFIIRCHRMGISSDKLKEAIINIKGKEKCNIETFEERCKLIDLLGEIIKKNKGVLYWGIKIMRDIKILNKYIEIWPEAKFIHIVRDGRDVAASQMIDHSSWGYTDIESAALGWVDIINRARNYAKKFPVCEIRYEDLILTPEKTLMDICGFLEIEWDDSLMSHHLKNHSLFKNHYNHPSINSVINPMNDSSIGRYKKDLTQQDILIFNKIAFDVLNTLQYTVKFDEI